MNALGFANATCLVRTPLWALLLTSIAASCLAAPPAHRIEDIQLRRLPDGQWSEARIREPGSWGLRARLVLFAAPDPDCELALRVYAPAAFELRVDGVLLGSNGVVGEDAASEVGGTHFATFSLPPALRVAGTHQIELRASSWAVERVRGPLGIQLLDRKQTEFRERALAALYFLCAGILAVVALIFLALRPALRTGLDGALFAWLCAAVAVLLVAEHSKFLVPYPYRWHVWRLVFISIETALVGLLLCCFVAAHLGRRRLGRLCIATGLLFVLLMVVSNDPDQQALRTLIAAIAISIAIALASLRPHPRRAAWLLSALAVNLPAIALTGFRFADHWFFLGFLAMVALLLVGMIRDVIALARERSAAIRQSERLRFELQQRTIQPHYLMNTLSAALGSLEPSATRGRRILSDLAAQLSSFFAIGEREWVALREEWELCEHHVRGMAHLTELPLELTLDGSLPPAQLPPGVLLTLIENAIKHGRLREDPGIRARADLVDGVLELEVENAATQRAAGEGTGLRFVRAQLARPDVEGELQLQAVDGRWRARVRIPQSR